MIILLISIAVVFALADVVYRPEEDQHCNRTVDIHQAVSNPPVTNENRNRPLHCTYRIRVRPARNDWVVFVRFIRMRVGEPSEDRKKCIGGYIQIIDGYRDSNHSNKEDPGFYCGEIDSPKTFVSETPHVKIVLHVDSYSHDTFFQFNANVEQQQEVHARYGQYAQLYPHRRGTPVPGTYCERTFYGCAPTRCFVQSPGFPEIYPRNLHCRYSLVVSRSVVALDLNAFDVDGLRCDNMLLCFPRPVTRDPNDCPFDHVKVYDGPTEDSPLIVTLCGRGRLKSQIVASGSEMLVEFVTSRAGPLLNTGFHFKAESIHSETETEYQFPRLDGNGTCAIERYLRPTDVLTFGHLRSWYPVNTTCTYRFTASEDEVIRITFEFFRMERVTMCDESLKLYDSPTGDASKIISKLCDINKPRTEHPRSVYETTGPGLFIEFISKIGSLEGSSLSYAFEVRPVNILTRRNSVNGGSCSRTFTPENGMTGLLTGHPFGDSSNTTSLTCNYTFEASQLPQGRVQMVLFTSLRLVSDCAECRLEPMYAEMHLGLGERICFCKVSAHRIHKLSSLGPRMFLFLHAESSWEKKLPQKHIVNGSYAFYTESRCGPERMELDLQGLLTFPPLIPGPGTCPEGQCPTTPLFCSWKIPVFHRMDLLLKVDGLPTNANCSTDHAMVNSIVLCPTSEEQEVLLHKEDIESDVIISLRMSEKSYNFTVRWTQLRMLPSRTTSDTLVSLGKDCDFLCTSSMACLTRELVCNGIGNCPGPATSADEDPNLCILPRDSFKLFWWIIGFSLSICLCLKFCLVFTLCRKCRVRRHRI
ncbi:uncharacterized protein LOC129217104 [Uloborus diversus]|uniref:uncharacterized protein LOC129217104 n=1 Tax=Uloborus diversus TaxID=327109 RepID=UPI002409F603|nr:uncharacterized protein LOC129217104 [Uloborus diversus]